MKKILIPLLLIFCLQVYGNSRSSSKDEDVKSIPIEKSSGNTTDKPRSYFTSIVCYYSAGSFQFNFYETYSEVEIKILNTSTNEEWSYSIDDFKSIIRVPASPSAGTYLITIYIDTDYYTGIFLK